MVLSYSGLLCEQDVLSKFVFVYSFFTNNGHPILFAIIIPAGVCVCVCVCVSLSLSQIFNFGEPPEGKICLSLHSVHCGLGTG